MRRGLYIFIVAALAVSAQQEGVKPKVALKVEDRFVPAPFEAQKIGGVLGERMRVNLEGRLLHIEENDLLAGYRQRPGNHPWIGEHIGKYLHAAANTCRLTNNEALRWQMTRVAQELLKTQKDDGYLGTYLDKDRWTSWDVWSHKYNLIGLLAYYELTGGERALTAASKIGTLLWQVFVQDGRDIIASSTHVGMAATSVLEPLCRLYRYTGDKRHLELAMHITKTWEQPNGPKLVSSLLTHGNVSRTANGKAYEMMSDLVGLLELYRLTGEKEFFDAPRRAQNDIVERRRFITGTVSNYEYFQDDFLLPAEQDNNVGEGCATVTWLQLNWHLLRLTGEARYADELERTVFNQLLAAQDAKTGDICYFTPMNGAKSPRTDINCCRSSEPRGISMIPQLVWGNDNGAVKILMYAPGELKLDDVHIVSQTDFPSTGKVRLLINPTRPGTRIPIMLRVPSWTKRFTVTSAGRQMEGRPGQFVSIDRTWSGPDRIEIDMDMTVQVVDGGKSYPNHVAIQRGPQVMALEKSINADVRFLFRAGLRSNFAGDGITVPGVVPASDTSMRDVEFHMVPFSEAKDYRIWLSKPGTVKTPFPSRAAFGKQSVSSRGPSTTGTISDERTDTWVSTNPGRTKPGEKDWFVVELREPGSVRRIVYTGGPVNVDGGGFDPEKGSPLVEIQRAKGGAWERVGELNGYQGTAGERVELTLAKPIGAVAVRVSGYAKGQFVTCAEIEAYE